MAKIKPERAFETIRIDRFKGISCNTRFSDGCAADMKNFRICSDGSLEKRSGFRVWLSPGSEIRGFWQGSLDGQNYTFVVASSSVYAILPGSDSLSERYVLATVTGDVNFEVFHDILYLFDGNTVLRFQPATNNFTEATGYVPLYGKNWHPTYMGDVNEPRNMLNARLRIHYLNTTYSASFTLPFTAQSIDFVRVDGSPIYSYTFTPQTNTFQIPSALVGGTVEVGFTLSSIFNQRPVIVRASRTAVCRDNTHETLLCYGGSAGYRIYRSAAVSDSMLDACKSFYATSDPLYIQVDSAFSAGDSQHPVTVISRDGNRMLVFNDRNLWTLKHPDQNSDEMQLDLIPMAPGCTSRYGAAVCEGKNVILSDNGVYELTFSAGNPEVCSAKLLSLGVSDQLDSTVLQNGILFWVRSRNELWLRLPTDPDGTVLIRDFNRNEWIRFEGIPATLLFERDGNVGFATSDGNLCLTDNTCTTDNGAPIRAFYRSQYLNFSHPEVVKRSLHFSLNAEATDSVAKLLAGTETVSREFVVSGTDMVSPKVFDCRLNPGRFRVLNFCITDDSGVRSRFYFLSVTATR